MQGSDLFAPGLAGVGLRPDRLILAQCGRSVLAVMEEALRHSSLAAVVGEVEGRLGLTASRRLQLAAEASGVTAFAIRRSRRHDDPALLAPSAAASRWRISAAPHPAGPAGPTGQMPDRMLWRLQLLRCRGTAFVSHWTLQACDVRHRLAILEPALLHDRPRAAGSGICGCRTGRSTGSGAMGPLRLTARRSPPRRSRPRLSRRSRMGRAWSWPPPARRRGGPGCMPA